jgi:hypothetical protein
VSNDQPSSSDEIKTRIVEQLRTKQIRFTLHAHQEMVAENFSLDDVLDGLANSEPLENYPEHKRDACGLFGGVVLDGRPVHIVCTTAHPVLIVITVYEPKPPKWLTPTQRNH